MGTLPRAGGFAVQKYNIFCKYAKYITYNSLACVLVISS